MDRRYKRDVPPDGWVDPSDSDPRLQEGTMATPKMTGLGFVKLICDTLGIADQGVYGVRITANLTSTVNVEIQTRLSTDDARKIVQHLESFTVDPTAFEAGLADAVEKAKAFTPVKLAPKKLAAEPDFAEAERAITGRGWKDCPVCKAVRIELDKDKCQGCGGKLTNCVKCGEGRSWWYSGECLKCGTQHAGLENY